MAFNCHNSLASTSRVLELQAESFLFSIEKKKIEFTIYVNTIPNLGINSMLENMIETYKGKTNH